VVPAAEVQMWPDWNHRLGLSI